MRFLRDLLGAGKTYAKDQQRGWRETPGRSTKSLRKLEGTTKRQKAKKAKKAKKG
jgi:hypothetical protein